MQSAKLQRLLQEAVAHLQAGRPAAAARLCEQARSAAPRDFQALFLSGVAALKQKDFSAAADWLARARRRDPRSAACARRLGFALAKLGRPGEAERALRAALAISPADAEGWDALGYVLKTEDRLTEAIAAHRRATELRPERALSWHNLGQALLMAARPVEALACQEQALAVEPGFAKARFGRAMALQACHRVPEAIAAYAGALAREPDNHGARSYRLMALNYLDGTAREQEFAEHVAYGAAVDGSSQSGRIFPNTADPVRRLRVAFLSPDLRMHSIAYFLEPLLACMDRAQFEIVLYHDHFVIDAVSERLRGHAALWRNFIGQPDDAVEAAVRADAPDILVDLAGHTGLNRLPLLARRLAPVQISYLGYPNTTGLRTMDYRLVDAVTDPAGEADTFHTEKLVRFAPTAWSYAPPADAPEPKVRSRTVGSPVIFGCFNTFAKVTDETLAVWSRLLATVPDSRLRLKAAGFGEPGVADHVRARLARAGVEAGRVELVERTRDLGAHFALYQDVDVALDTFPYHGTTTTCEALWMGVPVVTRVGDRHASRVGASLLAAIGRPEWIARNWDDYVQIAAGLSRRSGEDMGKCHGLRDTLRMSPLMDRAGQAARFGAALRECWAAWCEGAGARVATAA